MDEYDFAKRTMKKVADFILHSILWDEDEMNEIFLCLPLNAFQENMLFDEKCFWWCQIISQGVDCQNKSLFESLFAVVEK